MDILDIFFPRRCLGCGRLGKYFCRRCRVSLRRLETSICPICEKPAIGGRTHPGCQTRYGINGLTSFLGYAGVAQKAIKTLKYRYVSDLASEFVSLVPDVVISNLSTLIPKPCIFVPIPLHSARARERGFNQAEVLGRLLAQRLNIPVQTDILRRVKKTTPQVEMKDRKARLKNMGGVFAIQKNLKSSLSSIVLFDDVFTTGATMRAAGSVLKRGGARFVWGITMAR